MSLACAKALGLCYKIFRTCNLKEIDRFRSKLATFGLGNYTSLTKQTHYLTTESIDYKSANVFIVQGPGVKGHKASPRVEYHTGVPKVD